VVAVGPAVRLVPYLQQTPKRYIATFWLGARSESGDLEQGVAETRPVSVTDAELRDAAARLTGEIDQTPPAHSAIKIGGRRAYERVRNGEAVEMPTRRVKVHALEVTDVSLPDVRLDITCGSGTYIRTLGMDLAALVGTTAVMKELTRQSVGPFTLDQALSIEQLRTWTLESHLRPPREGVTHLPWLEVDGPAARRLVHGQCIAALPAAKPPESSGGGDEPGEQEAAAIDARGRLRAIVRRRGRGWQPHRVFPAPDELT
jgi:tRNA pseudouridine55 synthase